MSRLQEAFSGSDFRKNAHQLVDLMADYLENAQSRQLEKVIPFENPEKSLAFWQNDFENNSGDLNEFFGNVIELSNHLHHPRYMGHQVTPPLPVTAMAGMLSHLLNNGMAVYEMGLVTNPLEKILSDLLAQKIGFDNKAGGLLTSGGTLATLTALLTARAAKTGVWEDGTTDKLAVMVSEEAHYCVDRAVRIMGLGSEGIIKVPTNEHFQMQTDLLEEYYQKAKEKGINVFCVVASVCSTSTGSYDNLKAVAEFAQKNNLWLHADGAHGGAVIFSEKYKYKTEGLSLADSVVIDWHKMLMTPALATAVVYKNDDDSYKTFQQKAQYLWANQESKDWFNSGKRTFECTKLMMSLKIYSIIKAHGVEIFGENIDYLYDLGKTFAQMIQKHSKFELAVEPECNIVCFRYSAVEEAKLNEINANIRKLLLETGKFYIVQTTLKDHLYLRVSLMNPLTNIDDLNALLDEIETIAHKFS